MADTSAKQPNKVEKEWKAEEVETLIHLYENEPMLWDISHSDYSKKDVRQKVLAKIEETLGNKFTIAEISDKISRIRSYYTIELKKVTGSKKSGAGTGDVYKSKWTYFDTLDAFLRPQIQPRKSTTNLDISCQDDESQEDESEADDDNLSEEASSGRQTPSDVKQVSKRRKLPGPAAVMAEAVSVLSSLKSRRSSITPPPVPQMPTPIIIEDEDLTFAKYLANEIRKVKHQRVKHGLKMKLQNAIFEAQQEDEDSIRQLTPRPWKSHQKAVNSGGFLAEMQSDMNSQYMTSSELSASISYPTTYTNM